eukprot:2664369-Amphidinium_carterae.1
MVLGWSFRLSNGDYLTCTRRKKEKQLTIAIVIQTTYMFGGQCFAAVQRETEESKKTLERERERERSEKLQSLLRSACSLYAAPIQE